LDTNSVTQEENVVDDEINDVETLGVELCDGKFHINHLVDIFKKHEKLIVQRYNSSRVTIITCTHHDILVLFKDNFQDNETVAVTNEVNNGINDQDFDISILNGGVMQI
jgi:hypothetical protein